jgi:hypothetical protein
VRAALNEAERRRCEALVADSFDPEAGKESEGNGLVYKELLQR